ncbi:MAG: tetratricopeptide repeat protein [Pseudohongiellaceae bacterium]
MKTRQKCNRAARLHFASIGLITALLCPLVVPQDDSLSIENIEIPEAQRQLCFGFSDVSDPKALAVCDALNLDQNVKARELSEQWVRAEPNSPAAQFALSEVLLTIEGNMPRALFHLNRAEELTDYADLPAALESGNLQWHYLTLSQLSYVHQLMGDQLRSLEYLDRLEEVYGQDVESFRGWPLIKLKQYDAARDSANLVLQNSDNERERSRAWNTLCAVELASLQPIESMTACDRAIDEDENIADSINDYDTVYLSNASEVALSLLKMDEAEEYLNRATRYLNTDSVANPWIYKLYLLMNQGRFDESREALDRMLVWREAQEPIVNVMNRAEHFLVTASFFLLAGYSEDAIKLTRTALNQPDRNGSYSADDEQKDSMAALINMMANRMEYQIRLEKIATMDFFESLSARIDAMHFQLAAWRSERRAAALFAEFDVLQNRLRPYAPLDVHIPEWIEPEIVGSIGTGVMSNMIEQANSNGAFMLNAGYYHAYKTEVAALQNNRAGVIAEGTAALSQLPVEEVLLRARLAARMAALAWRNNDYAEALSLFETAYRQDPSILRRLAMSLPVTITTDGSEFSEQVADYLSNSPRFAIDANGMGLEVSASPDLSLCLKTRTGTILSCYTMAAAENESSKWNAQQLTQQFHTQTFGLGYEISKAQRSILMGSSVILSSQNDRSVQRNREAVLDR